MHFTGGALVCCGRALEATPYQVRFTDRPLTFTGTGSPSSNVNEHAIRASRIRAQAWRGCPQLGDDPQRGRAA
jgi:hypothetical protein